jgi:hypothetical protein
MIKFLEDHPFYGVMAAMISFLQGITWEYMVDMMEISQPAITWLSMVLGCGVAGLTFIIKLKQLFKKKENGDTNDK